MKAFLLLLSMLGALTWAQTTTPIPTCECPLVKCPSSNAAALCQCLNSRETMCKKACPTYQPTYLPCPMNPPTSMSTSVPTPTSSVQAATNCTCEETFCIQQWPQSCYCQNAQKQRCYEKCGGTSPDLQDCPPLETPSPVINPFQASDASTVPDRVNTHAPCGGGRSNYRECDDGEVCIKDPYRDGCGPACDQEGICVKDKLCGGFAGFPCGERGQVCEDDPRDDCDPLYGGSDCGGLCIWPLSLRET